MDELRVVEIVDPRIRREGTRLFTTLEGENPSGSMKDRMVRGELDELMATGKLKPGDRLSEVSAGSTGRSLAYHCRELGLVCDLFVPDILPREETDVLEQLGANVYRGSREEGYALYEEFCAREHPHQLDQLGDTTLARHYHALGTAANRLVGPIDAVLGAVGTGHSLLGIAAAIDPRPFVATAEPAEPFAIHGVRNLELERFGPQDACTPDLFDLRLVVEARERSDFGRVATDRGEMTIGRSFALVLAAVGRLLEQRPSERLFLLGAENRL
jgi:cysteine synthase